MFVGMVIGIVVALIVGGIFLIVAFNAKANFANAPRTSRTIKVTAEDSKNKVAESIRRFGKMRGMYNLEQDLEDKDIMVLGMKPSMASWGFFFPIWMKELEDGKTELTVGIKSKVFQWGPVVTKNHKKLVEHLQKSL